MHESQIGRADSTSPNGMALRLSGNVHATSYIGSSRGRAIEVTLRNVHRRSGVAAASGARGGVETNGRCMIDIAGP